MATPDRPKRTSKRRTSVAKAPEKPAEKLEDLKAKRMQEAEILRQRMRDAGMLSPVPPAYPVPSATGPSRVQILIEGDDVTIIQHGSAPDQPTFWGYAETPLLGEYADSRLFLEYAKSRLYFGYADLPLMAKGVLQYFGYQTYYFLCFRILIHIRRHLRVIQYKFQIVYFDIRLHCRNTTEPS